jgi:hypothetical protein
MLLNLHLRYFKNAGLRLLLFCWLAHGLDLRGFNDVVCDAEGVAATLRIRRKSGGFLVATEGTGNNRKPLKTDQNLLQINFLDPKYFFPILMFI